MAVTSPSGAFWRAKYLRLQRVTSSLLLCASMSLRHDTARGPALSASRSVRELEETCRLGPRHYRRCLPCFYLFIRTDTITLARAGSDAANSKCFSSGRFREGIRSAATAQGASLGGIAK